MGVSLCSRIASMLRITSINAFKVKDSHTKPCFPIGWFAPGTHSREHSRTAYTHANASVLFLFYCFLSLGLNRIFFPLLAGNIVDGSIIAKVESTNHQRRKLGRLFLLLLLKPQGGAPSAARHTRWVPSYQTSCVIRYFISLITKVTCEWLSVVGC